MAVAINFVVCEGVRADPTNFHRVNVYGVSGRVRPRGRPAFPYYMPRLTAYLLFTEPDTQEVFTIQVVRADTGAVVARNTTNSYSFPGGRDQIVGLTIHTRRCPFPLPGLYWVECWGGGQRIARQRLYVVP
jgi:hypothetical protein